MIAMRFSNETDAARQAGTPLMALESTLISHGLPHPDNIDVARRAEEAVRGAGAAPATMAVLDGVAHIGLDDAAITQLATQAGVVKLSRRDLPVALSGSEAAPADRALKALRRRPVLQVG